MTIAAQIKAFYTTTNPYSGLESYDWDGLIAECDEKGEANQDWDNESTEYDFADGSVLIINSSDVRVYGSR